MLCCGQLYRPEVLAAVTPHVPYRWTMAYLLPGDATNVYPAKVSTSWKPVFVLWLQPTREAASCVEGVGEPKFLPPLAGLALAGEGPSVRTPIPPQGGRISAPGEPDEASAGTLSFMRMGGQGSLGAATSHPD